MIWLDIVFLVPLIWGAYNGFKKGLIAQVIGIISLLAGVWVGINCKELVTPFIIEKVQEKYLSISCFLVLFFSSNNFWNYNFKDTRKICQLYSIEMD